MKRTLLTSITLLLAAGMCFAQGQQSSRRGGGSGTSQLDMSKLQNVTGAITAVNIGYGIEYPSITLNKVQIKMAPVWYLLDKGFEAKIGDSVSLVAAPSTVAADRYLYAVEVTNTVSKLRIVLRDGAGVPLWSGRGNPAEGPVAEGGCWDASAVAGVTGTIDKVNMGVGIQMPTLTLKTSDGKLLVLKLGPERVLLEADLELKAGDVVTVSYVQATCTDELIALSITTSSGTVVTLRDGNRGPAWR